MKKSIRSTNRQDALITKNNKICLFILENKLKNIIITAVDLIFIMTRDFEKTLIERTKSVSDMLSFKKIDEKNVEKFFDVEKNDLFYNAVTQ